MANYSSLEKVKNFTCPCCKWNYKNNGAVMPSSAPLFMHHTRNAGYPAGHIKENVYECYNCESMVQIDSSFPGSAKLFKKELVVPELSFFKEEQIKKALDEVTKIGDIQLDYKGNLSYTTNSGKTKSVSLGDLLLVYELCNETVFKDLKVLADAEEKNREILEFNSKISEEEPSGGTNGKL